MVQAVQMQLDQANVEHAAVLAQLRGLHSVALEEVRHLRQQRRASPSGPALRPSRCAALRTPADMLSSWMVLHC